MDREFSPQQLRARWLQHGKRWIIIVTAAAALGTFGFSHLKPAVDRATLNIAVVERGPIDAVVNASGTIVPLAEQTVSSPMNAEVLKVVASLGEAVQSGQIIMQLDDTAAKLALSRLQEELALKKEELRSSDLQLSDAIRESRSRAELLAIDLESRAVRLQRLQKLGDTGIVSAQELLEAQLNRKRTEIEIEQVRAQTLSLQARREAEVERLRLACSIHEKQIADQARRVALASVAAPRAGVVTYLVDQQGSSVTEGQILVTVAGQESFRVEATLSDFYAPQLKAGQRARIQQSSGSPISGRVARIVSSTSGSQSVLYIDLDNPSAPTLRANTRVNVDIVTMEKPSGLKVRRGSSLKAGGVQYVYVVRRDKALRTKVHTGLSTSDSIEIIDGLVAGDRVVVSDMSAYQHDQIQLR